MINLSSHQAIAGRPRWFSATVKQHEDGHWYCNIVGDYIKSEYGAEANSPRFKNEFEAIQYCAANHKVWVDTVETLKGKRS